METMRKTKIKCDGQVSIDQNVRVSGSFSARKDLDTLDVKVGSDGVSLGTNGNFGPVSMNGIVTKGADGMTYLNLWVILHKRCIFERKVKWK